jgi:hypothetical protein
MVYDRNIELKEKQEKLLAELRKIVGRGFECSEAYMKQCKWEANRIGEQDIRYGKVTKKYVYIGCRVIYSTNEENTEYGAIIRKYPICKVPSFQIVNKIALEDLFVKDLEKIVDDIKFALWWENQRMKKIKAEMEECQKYVDMYNKFCLK